MSAPVETPRSAVALLVGAKLVASSHWSGDASIFGHTVINEHQGWTKRSTFLASSLNPLIIFNRHIKTAEQRTIIQQYGDWYTDR